MHRITEVLSDICPIIHCSDSKDQSTIYGTVHPPSVKNDELEPLTIYFHDAIHVHKSIRGDSTAVTFYDKRLTFNELDLCSTLMAQHLMESVPVNEQNTKPDRDVVFAVCLPPSEKLIVVLFAILKTGAAYLPLDSSFPEDLVFNIVKRYKPQVVIAEKLSPILFGGMSESGDFDGEPRSTPSTTTAAAPKPFKLLVLEDLWDRTIQKSNAILGRVSVGGKRKGAAVKLVEPYSLVVTRAPTTKTRLAVLLQVTRLTSDNPKGVRISHLNIMNRILWASHLVQFSNKGLACLADQITSAQSIPQIFGTLLRGVPILVTKDSELTDMEHFIRTIAEYKVVRICLTPNLFQDFLNTCLKMESGDLRKSLRQLKIVICRGQLLSKDLVLKFHDVFTNDKCLLSLYGHPELAGDLICERYKSVQDVEQKSLLGRILVGATLPNTRIYLLDSHLKQVEHGEQGQICVSGLSVAMGYVDRSDDKGKFVDNPYKDSASDDYDHLFCTGDFGRMIRCRDRKLRLRIEGRTDQLVLHKDHLFDVGDIKESVLKLDEVDDVHIQVIHPETYEQSLVAFVVLRKNFINTLGYGDYLYFQLQIKFTLDSVLPDFMQPQVVLLDHIPVVETGRVDGSDLLQQYEAERESDFADWDSLAELVGQDAMDAARVLLTGLYKFCAIPVEVSIKALNLSAFDLGCDSNSALSVQLFIVAKEFPITLQDFVAHTTLLDLIDLMEEKSRKQKKKKQYNVVSNFQDLNIRSDYTAQIVEDRHKRTAIHLLATCYTQKGDLEHYNMVRYEDFVYFLESNWSRIVRSRLCVCCVRNWDFKLVGIVIANDFFAPLDYSKARNSLNHVFELSTCVKSQFLEEIPHDQNNTLECVLIGTSVDLPARENVKIVTLLLTEMRRLAEMRNYSNIYLVTSNHFVEELCHYMMNFIILDQYPASDYVEENGTIPFRCAPNTVKLAALLCNSVQFGNPDQYKRRASIAFAGAGGAKSRRRMTLDVHELSDRIFR